MRNGKTLIQRIIEVLCECIKKEKKNENLEKVKDLSQRIQTLKPLARPPRKKC